MNKPYEFVMESPAKSETIINGNKYLYFGGVSYYQLHSHPEVVRAAKDAVEKYGINSATSLSYTGVNEPHLKVEKQAAKFFNSEDAAYLPSGYLTNIAGIQALNNMIDFDVIFIDETAHYCNMDAAYTVKKPVIKFKNNDPNDLELKIKEHLKQKETPLVITDGLFSVYGKLAPIPVYLKIVEKNDGIIWVDDSHCSGVIGPNGRGTFEYFQLKSDRLFFGSTLSKAFGGFGGIIPGSKEFIKRIRTGRVMEGGSKPDNAAAAASYKGLEIVMEHPEMRTGLWDNAQFLKSRLNAIGLDVEENYFPMTAFTIGSAKNMKEIHEKLLKDEIFIQYSNYVGSGSEGALRIVVFSTHKKSQIRYLVNSLERVI